MEEKSKIFENGATWLRTDFHLHTRADKEFSFASNENDFVRLYIERRKEQKVNAGIITNHNKPADARLASFLKTPLPKY